MLSARAGEDDELKADEPEALNEEEKKGDDEEAEEGSKPTMQEIKERMAETMGTDEGKEDLQAGTDMQKKKKNKKKRNK